MSESNATMGDGELQVVGKIEVRDNWYVITVGGKLAAIGTWLPPDTYMTVRAERVDPEIARVAIEELRQRTIGGETFYSMRVAHNNRLLTVGAWQPPYPVHGIQDDRLMPDQARELLAELEARTHEDTLVGVMEIKG